MSPYTFFLSGKKRFSFYALMPVVFAFLLSFESQSQVLPGGFQRVLVSSSLPYPSAMAFAPDGRVFVTSQTGNIRIVKNGKVLSTPFLQINVGFKGESGLIGITLDPNYPTNQYVYVQYTLPDGTRNRISRFKGNGDIGDPSSELVLLDLDANLGRTNHMGGGLQFGKDGKLYVAVGDKTVPTTSPDMDTYFGKLLRINSDGSVPSGNPYTTGSEQKRRIWAHGLRNPFSFDIQPGTGKIFVNDVGNSSWEEVNNITTGGKNFGWPSAEGMSNNSNYTNPLYTYPHGDGANKGCAITGGAFFNPQQTNYPSMYQGKYFFQDHCNGWIDFIDPNSSTPAVSHFASQCGEQILGLRVGTDGNLYYFERVTKSLYKIIYSNSTAPTIVNHPSSKTVAEGQPVSFSVTATGTTPLSYQWQKNNVNINGANSSTYTIAQTTRASEGNYKVIVSNTLGNVTSNSALLTVTAFNAPPDPIINTPTAGTQFRGGMTIQFSGTATDAEDGTLPASAFTWFMTLHHDQHIHEIPPIATGVRSGQHTFSVSDETSANIFYRLKLVVVDSKGLTDTVYRDILPFKSTLSFATQPAGLQLTLDGSPITTPYSVVGVEGVERLIGVVPNQSMGGKNYIFSHWLHGGSASQTISTPVNNTTYTAVFAETTGCLSTGTILSELWMNIHGKDVNVIPVNTTPASTRQLSSFEATSMGDNYGQRIRGYLCVPETGVYTFYISGDDNVELWLGTNDSPTTKRKIAHITGSTAFSRLREWNKFPSQTSAQITLLQGHRYYVEALQKESAGGDHISVGWKLPNSSAIAVIAGNYLSPAGSSSNNPPSVTLTSPANGSTYFAPASITLSASASDIDGSIQKVEFFQGNTKIGEDVSSPYTFNWENVSTGAYILSAKVLDDAGNIGSSPGINITVSNNCSASGTILKEVWNNIGGKEVSLIPVGRAPSSSEQINILESRTFGDVYGLRIRGFICAPQSGSYRFYISGDDNVELWLSTDNSPFNKTKIAHVTGPSFFTTLRQWTKYPSQQSELITLQQGKSYYVEVLQKEHGGGDHVSVAWVLPGSSAITVINGNYLSSPSVSSSRLSHSEENPVKQILNVYPNPSNGVSTEYTVDGLIPNESVKLFLYNQVGFINQMKDLNADGYGHIEGKLNENHHLPSGLYTLVISTTNTRLTERMIIVR